MFIPIFKVLISAIVITFASWLSNKKPELAGFIIALPIATILALLFSYTQYQDAEKSITFAKSIFVAVPLSLMFFIPFLIPSKIPFGFWGVYGLGLVFVIAGYLIHSFIMKVI